MTKEAERHEFQAEISRLLKILIHSVYSDKDVFLRELISNGSDACDKLRYLSVTKPDLVEGDADFQLTLTADADAKVLTVADNGIGMNREDLIANLGTIARSGTDAFLSALGKDQGDAGKPSDLSLIGQFGVGFYSAFMVADRVSVVSRKAGEEQTWVWESDGVGAFSVAEADAESGLAAALPSGRGTAIFLHLREDSLTYLEADTLRRVIKTHSDHVAFPIRMVVKDAKEEDEAEDAAQDAEETLNTGGALWARPKSEVTEDQYKEFYRHVAHGYDEPWATIHYKAEGRHEFSALLFVPGMAPFDLFEPERKGRLKLYVNRVFITDEAPFLPPYLRFIRGVIDSSDIPLTVSREMLQNNPLVSAIGSSVAKKVLGEIGRIAEKEPERYAAFWTNFGAVMKEGLYEDFERRETLFDLMRFRTTKAPDGWRSLKEILADFQDNQTAFYYVTGSGLEAVQNSPHLEGFKARNIEVLLLTDPVDSFWASAIDGFEGKPFTSITRGASDLASVGTAPEAEDKAAGPDETSMGVLIAAFKQTLGDGVKDVRKSDRLTESAVCLVAEDGGLDMHIEKLLKAQNPGQALPGGGRILEINPTHPLITALASRAKDGVDREIEDAAHLLLEQARIAQGESVGDPAAFVRRLQGALTRGL